MCYLFIEKRSGGFFSGFNLTAACLNFCYENNINCFYFNWHTTNYTNDKTLNFFDKFIFKQNKPKGVFPWTKVMNVFDNFHDFYPPIVLQEKIVKINNVLKYYNYFLNPIYKEIFDSTNVPENTLGVHVRRTDHDAHGDLLQNDSYFNAINSNLKTKQYKKIFLATDEYKIVNEFKKEYGNLIYVNENIDRSHNNEAIHRSDIFEDKDKLAIDVIKEGITLSKCKKLIFTNSNVSLYSRLINPDLNVEQIDTHIKFR